MGTVIKINAITVPDGAGDELAHRFAARAGSRRRRRRVRGLRAAQAHRRPRPVARAHPVARRGRVPGVGRLHRRSPRDTARPSSGPAATRRSRCRRTARCGRTRSPVAPSPADVRNCPWSRPFWVHEAPARLRLRRASNGYRHGYVVDDGTFACRAGAAGSLRPRRRRPRVRPAWCRHRSRPRRRAPRIPVLARVRAGRRHRSRGRRRPLPAHDRCHAPCAPDRCTLERSRCSTPRPSSIDGLPPDAGALARTIAAVIDHGITLVIGHVLALAAIAVRVATAPTR